MKIRLSYIALLTTVMLQACSTDGDLLGTGDSDPQELKGITVSIKGSGLSSTRATATTSVIGVELGRNSFVADDQLMLTTFKRTSNAIDQFSYTDKEYVYSGTAWSMATKEKLYWTDAVSMHTIAGYSLPSSDCFWATGSLSDTDTKCYYGALGGSYINGNLVLPDTVDYSAGNTAVQAQDLLLLHNAALSPEENQTAAALEMKHALSSVRVNVNVDDYSSGSSSVDYNEVTISDVIIKNQPVFYRWNQVGDSVISSTSQDDISTIAGADYSSDTKRMIKLWQASSTDDAKTGTKSESFYGLVVPQTKEYYNYYAKEGVVTVQPVQISFTVSYPNAKTGEVESHTYTTSVYGSNSSQVYFNPGKCTTIDINMNHKNEKLTTTVSFQDWQFVATPDQGELVKVTNYLSSVDFTKVYTPADVKANASLDATWLHSSGNSYADEAGNDGSVTHPYLINTPDQLLTLAKMVNTDGVTFEGKYIVLNADIIMQASSDSTKAESSKSSKSAVVWPGIGTEEHTFQGTFWGANRYIHRLYGNPLFTAIGASGNVSRVQLHSISVAGDGVLANTNAGMIAGCRIFGDATLTGTGSAQGAVVGTNSGDIVACYHVGNTQGVATHVGGLVGSNTGSLTGCYHTGTVTGGSVLGGIVAVSSLASDKFIYGCYYNSTLFTTGASIEGVTGYPRNTMVSSGFVTMLNTALSEKGYTDLDFEFRPANYPSLIDTY